MIKRSYPFVIFCTLAALFIAACGNTQPQTNQIQTFDNPTCEEVTFDSGGEPVRALLCLPSGSRTNLPGVVFLHGSGAYEPPPLEIIPDANELLPFTIQEELAEHGYAALSILYFSRTPPQGAIPNTFIDAPVEAFAAARPVWLETIEDGIGYLRNRPEVDPDRIGLVGYSLGASLAMALDQTRTKSVAIILLSGEVWMDQDLEQLTAGNSPTLILYGDMDVIPTSSVSRIGDALEAHGIAHEVIEIKGADHTWTGQAGDEGFSAIVKFLDEHLTPP